MPKRRDKKKENKYWNVVKLVLYGLMVLVAFGFFSAMIYLSLTSERLDDLCLGISLSGAVLVIAALSFYENIISFIHSIRQKRKQNRAESSQIKMPKVETKEGRTKTVKTAKKEISLIRGREEPLTTGAILRELGITPIDLKKEKTKRRKEDLKRPAVYGEIKTKNTKTERRHFDKRSPILPDFIIDRLAKKGQFCCESNLHIGDIRGYHIIEELIIPWLKDRGINRCDFSIDPERNPKIKLTKEGHKKLVAVLSQDGIFLFRLEKADFLL